MEFEFVQRDNRGEIWKADIDGITYWMSNTKRGSGRGGDVHEGWQYNVFLKGSFEGHLMYPDGEEVRIYSAPSMVFIPPEVPHVFIALEDSYMIEWHDHELPPFSEKRYFEPYRGMCK